MKPNLDDLLEAQFILNYYGRVSLQDFNELPVYEFRAMMNLLSKYKQREHEARTNKNNAIK